MNKKGNSVQMVFFTGFNVAIGALILFGMMNLLNYGVSSQEELFSRDLALLIESVTASRSDVEIVYSAGPNYLLEVVSSDSVRVSSLEGSDVSEFRTFTGVEVIGFTSQRGVTLPIYRQGDELEFGIKDIGELRSFCNSLPGILDNRIVKVNSIGVGSFNFVENLNHHLGFNGYPIPTFDHQADILLFIGLHDGPFMVRYPERFPEYRKLGCFLGANMREMGVNSYREEVIMENILVIWLPNEYSGSRYSFSLADEIMEVTN